jgi:hypothetical protein
VNERPYPLAPSPNGIITTLMIMLFGEGGFLYSPSPQPSPIKGEGVIESVKGIRGGDTLTIVLLHGNANTAVKESVGRSHFSFDFFKAAFFEKTQATLIPVAGFGNYVLAM